ncbi:MAG TPA: HAD-IA family hydrolase [Xanthobacteraceae bacterium]|nr:HAD-IA family hydrolase [Xanthobacteraceae bacterium]
MVIFDCNGVLVDSESLASAVLAEALAAVGVTVTPETVARRFHGRRAADIFDAVEAATGQKLPAGFSADVAETTLRRIRAELRPVAHAARALTWIRGPKAVASSSPFERIRTSLEVTGLLGFFSNRLFSASSVFKGKPAPDIFLHAASRLRVEPAECIVVEDSAAGVTAALAAGMTPIGFVGGSDAPGRLAGDLGRAGARAVIADMRALHSTIVELRGH